MQKTVAYKQDSNKDKVKISENKYFFNKDNKTKFSSVTPGLIDKLKEVKVKKRSAEKIDTSIAYASTATRYEGNQGESQLQFYTTMYYFGSDYHDVDIKSTNNWVYPGYGTSDGGARDGMDIEWNPSNLYMGSVVYQPNTPTIFENFANNGTHDVSIDKSSEYYGSTGGYYVEPDHCSQTNYVEVYLYPVSSSVYGQTSNYYSNYIHDSNFLGLSSISFSIAYGAFAISSSPFGTSSWKHNNWSTYTI